MRPTKFILLMFFAVCSIAFTKSQDSEIGILLLAHGGKPQWNDHVKSIASDVNSTIPTEVAFGMANKQQIETAVQNLIKRNVKRIVAVPLFISSHSSVIRSTEYLLGLRQEKPPEVELFAKMDHSNHGTNHEPSSNSDPVTPIPVPVPLKVTSALDAHPAVADILLDRALSISKDPHTETVILVAHGPVSGEDDKLWLKDMQQLAERISTKAPFHDVQAITVRDDALAEVRNEATDRLRKMVQLANGRRVLVVPLLLSYGGIEEGIRKRLEGLDYIMPEQALLPDKRIANWVLDSASLK